MTTPIGENISSVGRTGSSRRVPVGTSTWEVATSDPFADLREASAVFRQTEGDFPDLLFLNARDAETLAAHPCWADVLFLQPTPENSFPNGLPRIVAGKKVVLL